MKFFVFPHVGKISLEWSALEGDSPVFRPLRETTPLNFRSSNAWECIANGRYTSAKAKYDGKTDSAQVAWAKDEKHFGERVKEYLKPLWGKGWTTIHD